MNTNGIWHWLNKLRTERWTGWAKSQGERYGRIAERRRGPVMLLIQSANPEERWIQASWTIKPQIHLSVHPILRETVRTQTIPNGHQQMGAWGSSQSIFTKPASLVYMPGARFSPESALPESEAVHLLSHDTSHQVHEVQKDRQLPFMSSAENYSWIETQNTQQVLPRLVQERKRIEQHGFYPPATMRQIRSVAPSAGSNEAAKQPEAWMTEATTSIPAEVFETSQGWRMSTKAASRPKIVPEVDLERLTEQVVRKIDERIVAHRERLGRNF
jgi:hypothetical protein